MVETPVCLGAVFRLILVLSGGECNHSLHEDDLSISGQQMLEDEYAGEAMRTWIVISLREEGHVIWSISRLY